MTTASAFKRTGKKCAVCCLAFMLPLGPAFGAETITYRYDAKGRLVEVKRTGTVNNNVTTTYSHDKVNNRKNTTTAGSPNAPPP
jgi:hypothetical protein